MPWSQSWGKRGRNLMRSRSSPALPARRSGFFLAIAAALALVVLIGFARTFYLGPVLGGEPLAPVVIVHGLAGTAWFALFAWQALQIRTGHVGQHRRNGAWAAAAIAAVSLTSLWIIVASLFDGIPPNNGRSEAETLLIRSGTLVWFLVLVSLGLRARAEPARHKRFMTLATIAMLAPAFARIGRLLRDSGGPALPFDSAFLAIGFIGALAWRDRAVDGRIHPVTAWWGGGYLVWVLIRLPLSQSAAWRGLVEPVLLSLGGAA